MKAYIHELGVIDKTKKIHPVRFKEGLNIVTGKSSTGKSALIEIFDYCFGSTEYTVPKGVITENANLYYVYLCVNEQDIVIGRSFDSNNKGFFRREDKYYPEKVSSDYFLDNYFISLDSYKQHIRSLFLDIDDVDESLTAKANRNKKAPTPSIRSFVSFMLQHQNLVANKHALFYRFDEKEKREQVIEHIKIFLGLVDQSFFHLSQEKEHLTAEVNRIKREQEAHKKLIENHKQKVEPVLRQLYAGMGFDKDPIPLQEILRHPQDAKERLEQIIRPEKIELLSDAATQHYLDLQQKLTSKTAELRKSQRKAGSIKRHLEEEDFAAIDKNLQQNETVHIARSVCPFCRTEHEQLNQSAEQLKTAISQLSNNLSQAKPMLAKLESALVDTQREIQGLSKDLKNIQGQISEIDKSERLLSEKKSLYESILGSKAKLDMLLDSLNIADDLEIDKRLKEVELNIKEIEKRLAKYNAKEELKKADAFVNDIMKEIGQNFDFEDGYKPINLRFSFETFDLYHLTSKNEKIFLRSMGSGANWLYSHITLFLALHKYFASLGNKCAIPSILFLDQPTQVYFPSFKLDKSEKFDKETIKQIEHRTEDERPIDDDITAVENLFSQLSIYCDKTKKEFGFTPQIIVTDHADNLKLSDGADFEKLVGDNRWRNRGLIHPIPDIRDY